jgi:general secretion pathway protein L
LVLDSAGILRKEVRLPIAAESNLRQVLGFEMDRQTPFRAGDVYFDWTILGHDKEAGQVRVDLAVVPRAGVDATCQILAARGLSVSGVDVVHDGLPLGLNLLPPSRRIKVINRKVRIDRVLAAGAVFLLALVMVLSLALRSHQVRELEQAIEEVREEALRVQRIRDQIGDTSESASFLSQRRAASPVAVDVLADITRTLPDDTYLDRLVIGQQTVQMQGKSRNAQQLIEQVNLSPMMEAASFRGSTRLDPRTGLEVFEINANITLHESAPGADG